MKTVAKALVLGLLAAGMFSSTALAATRTSTINRIYPSGNRIYFNLTSDCTSNEYSYHYIDVSTTLGDSQYKLLLSSALAGKAITINYSTCPSGSSHQPINYLYQDY